LSRVDVQECTSNRVCRDAFGWGQVCGQDGLCGPLDAEVRCRRTTPPDLLEDPEGYSDLIVLGSVYDDDSFPLEVQAIELAVLQVNDNGGLQGRGYGFVHCTNVEDLALDKLDQETANAEMTLYLADQVGVAAIVGPATSGRTQDAYLLAEPLGTVIISPSATSPSLTALDGLDPTDDDPGLLWRTAPPDSLQGVVMALDMQRRGITSVAVVHQTGAYGEGLSEVFAEEFVDGGGSATLYPFDDATIRGEQVTDAGATGVQEVLFISSEKSDTVAFLNSVGGSDNYEFKGLFLPDGGFDLAIFTEATQGKDKFDDVRGTAPSSPDNLIYEAFTAAFSAEYGDDAKSSGFTSYAFDASWLAIYGTAWSWFSTGDITGIGIAKGLRKIADPAWVRDHGEPLALRPTSWSTVVASFETLTAIDIDGSSGSLDFDPETEETTNPIDIWVVGQGGNSLAIICTVEPGMEDEADCPGWD
jgi:branched-chain amino acid transport system substrate-binding protein